MKGRLEHLPSSSLILCVTPVPSFYLLISLVVVQAVNTEYATELKG